MASCLEMASWDCRSLRNSRIALRFEEGKGHHHIFGLFKRSRGPFLPPDLFIVTEPDPALAQAVLLLRRQAPQSFLPFNTLISVETRRFPELTVKRLFANLP